MQRCRNCGASNSADNQFCEECGHGLAATNTAADDAPMPLLLAGSVLTAPPIPPPVVVAPPVTAAWTGQVVAAAPRIAGTKIALSEGEHLWRTYPLVHFRPFRRNAHGNLYVTDSRVIMHAQARKMTGRTSLLQEVRIESITGLSSHIDRGLGLVGTILLIIWSITGLGALVRGSAVGIIMLIFAALVVLTSYYYGRLGLRIYTSNSTPGPISFGNFGVSRVQGWLGPLAVLGMIIGGVQATDVLYCFPEHNAEDVVAELGALIFDLNRQGTLTGTQWEPVIQ